MGNMIIVYNCSESYITVKQQSLQGSEKIQKDKNYNKLNYFITPLIWSTVYGLRVKSKLEGKKTVLSTSS
jgi:hypothetical protein